MHLLVYVYIFFLLSERVRGLLYNLALLEYNDFYWRSHPVIRTLPAYEAARKAVTDG